MKPKRGLWVTFAWSEDHLTSNSPAIILEVTPHFNRERWPYQLNIPVFFQSMHEGGHLPLLTCSCGSFGCGGYYTDATLDREHDTWMIQNWYDPNDAERLVEAHTYCTTWENLHAVGREIIAEVMRLRDTYAIDDMRNGTVGADLVKGLPYFEECLRV